MNRRERRRLQKQGVSVPKERTLVLKESSMKQTALDISKDTIRHEINQQLLDADKRFNLDLDTTYLWILHKNYGFGAKRLKQFYRQVFHEHIRMRLFYEMDDTYPEREKLKEIGADVEEWYDELFNQDGTYKEVPTDV